MQVKLDKNGRITIPKAIRDELGLNAGDRMKYIALRDGGVALLKVVPVSALRGFIKSKRPVTIEEMNEAAIDGAVDRYLRAINS